MDFTGDGIADILSGCYWSQDENKPNGNPQAGYLTILAGTEDGNFEEALPLTDSDGNPLINIKLTKEQEENYVGSNIELGNICTSQHAVDYDGDGDLDLVTGCFGSSFFLFTNSADDPSKPPTFDSPATLLSVGSPDRHSDPHLYDWDGDGDLDLLTGSDSGSVYLSINQGTRQEPEWSDFTRLIRGSTQYHQSIEEGERIEPGRGSRVWVTDYNHDGKPDLIVGDNVTIQSKVAGLTQAKASRLKAAHEKKMQPLQAKMNEIRLKYADRIQELTLKQETEEAKELTKQMQEEMAPISMEFSELYQERNKFVAERRTGHVWVYLQQGAPDSAPSKEQTISATSESHQEPERPL